MHKLNENISPISTEATNAINALCLLLEPSINKMQVYSSLCQQIDDGVEINQALLDDYFSHCEQNNEQIKNVNHGKFIPSIIINFCANAIRLDGVNNEAITYLTTAWYWLGMMTVMLNEHSFDLELVEKSKSNRPDIHDKNDFCKWIIENEIYINNVTDLFDRPDIKSEWMGYEKETLKRWYKLVRTDAKLQRGAPKQK